MTAYDYVVVGGGSAGCIAAKRLAQKYPDAQVALFEAGPPDTDDMILNLSRWSELLGSQYDYDYAIAPQPEGNGDIRHSRGRMLGGSSAMNTCIAFQAPASDFEAWVQAGAVGWSHAEVTPYYEKLFGTLHREQTAYENPLLLDFLEAGAAAGYPIVDFSVPFDEGCGLFYLNKRGHYRQSSAVAYLRDCPHNLSIMTDTPILRLEITGHRVKAIHTLTDRITVLGTCILSAGAFNTPQLLQCSGIGPASLLSRYDIPVQLDLPVGRHLLDHPEGVMTWGLKGPMPEGSVQRYEAGLFARVDSDAPWPDLMFHMGLEPFTMQTAPKGYPVPAHGFSLTPNVTRARSAGVVEIRSANMLDAPFIDFCYFTDPDGYDARIMTAGLKIAREIAHQSPLSGWIEDEACPGMDVQTDEALSAYVRSTANTVYHPAGTCKMGALDDECAVVSPDMKLKGVDNLYVADASIFPHMVSVNPNMTVMMIGERVAAGL